MSQIRYVQIHWKEQEHVRIYISVGVILRPHLKYVTSHFPQKENTFTIDEACSKKVSEKTIQKKRNCFGSFYAKYRIWKWDETIEHNTIQTPFFYFGLRLSPSLPPSFFHLHSSIFHLSPTCPLILLQGSLCLFSPTPALFYFFFLFLLSFSLSPSPQVSFCLTIYLFISFIYIIFPVSQTQVIFLGAKQWYRIS